MRNIIITCCILLQALMISAQCDSIKLNLASAVVFGELKTEIEVENFNNISALQMQIGWDKDVVQLKDFQFPFGSPHDFLYNETENWIRVSYVTSIFPPTAFLPDGDSMFDAYFEIIGPGDPNVTIQEDENFITEIGVFDEAACLEITSNNVVFDGVELTGFVYDDINKDCILDTDDESLSGWQISFTSDNDQYYRSTNSEGQYSVLLPEGEYEVEVLAPNHTWEMCQESFSLTLTSGQVDAEQSFLAQSSIDCPLMIVDIYTPRLRRCFENYYFVEWENQGSGIADEGEVVVQLDDNLDYISASITGAVYDAMAHSVTVDLGDVAPNESGNFNIKVLVDCDNTVLGQSHCTTANIYPNERCSIDPAWSGAELSIDGICEGDSIRFIITNVGDGAMDQTSGFIVVEDQVMRLEDEIQLAEDESYDIAFEANGSTYRVILEQPADFPFEDMLSQAIEACGENEEGTFSIGYVTMFSDFDANPFYDINCIENVGSYDPNDKQAWPKGYEDTELIENYVGLDYMIRFQNTGTDTAFTVVVTDEISENLDLTSLRIGSASHDYTYSIEEDRTLTFRFDNILLPDSTTNEAASNGFVAFTLQQVEDNIDGTVIDNKADIYFDFNDPIETNVVRRVVGSNFVDIVLSNNNLLSDIYMIYPNPASEIIAVNIPDSYQDLRFELYDLDARVVRTGRVNTKNKTIDVNGLNDGMYVIKMYDSNIDLGVQKVLILR